MPSTPRKWAVTPTFPTLSEEFREALDGYIEWYRCEKLEKSLGWKTVRQHREELGYAA